MENEDGNVDNFLSEGPSYKAETQASLMGGDMVSREDFYCVLFSNGRDKSMFKS